MIENSWVSWCRAIFCFSLWFDRRHRLSLILIKSFLGVSWNFWSLVIIKWKKKAKKGEPERWPAQKRPANCYAMCVAAASRGLHRLDIWRTCRKLVILFLFSAVTAWPNWKRPVEISTSFLALSVLLMSWLNRDDWDSWAKMVRDRLIKKSLLESQQFGNLLLLLISTVTA